ncbi:MAG TPA: hypothetical protein VHI51_10435 [Ktedonobacterales bacterium]|nr:hypothetical protein [Ktedonobacterales bacterium]
MRAFIDDTQRMMRRPGLLRATNGAPAPAEMREASGATGPVAAARYDYERSPYQAQPLASAAAYPIPGVVGAAYPQPSYPAAPRTGAHGGLGSATALPGTGYAPYALPGAALQLDPEVWLIALPNGAGGMRSLEGANRPGAIRVSRPYGHLRTVRPITPLSVLETPVGPEMAESYGDPVGVQVVTDGLGPVTLSPEEMAKRAKSAARSAARKRAKLAAAQRDRFSEGAGASALPAERPAPQIVSAVEVETDAGVFRVERPGSVLDHSDMAWAMAHLESGEPDGVVALPRRQLALLLTLLPTPEDPEQPEADSRWGWAHRLRGPWERGPLHPKGKLGRLIAIDPDPTGQGLHRACFELIGTDEVVWAIGVPCFRQGSVYELTPLGKYSLSRWLTWPIAKATRSRRKASIASGAERPEWEIARIVYRVGAPRWPLAGVVEPMGPIGVSG